MTWALELKRAVHGLTEHQALPVLEDFFHGGKEWVEQCSFDDGSQAQVSFFGEAGAETCHVFCFENGAPQRQAMKTQFTCDYLEPGVFVAGYSNGRYQGEVPVPFFSEEDMIILKQLVQAVRIFGPYRSDREPSTFEILPPGYEVGEEIMMHPQLIDLGSEVIEAYAISHTVWNWRPFHRRRHG
jgi:hypothetical protein